MAIDTPARIAIVGAGPIGLEAALYARFLGYDVLLFERGRVCEHLLAWSHVQFFTPFGQMRSTLGVAAIRAQDPTWRPPADDRLLSGQELFDSYYRPLAETDLLVDCIRPHTEVLSVARQDLLKSELPGDDARADSDFRLLVRTARAPDFSAAVGGSAEPAAEEQIGTAVHERIETADAIFDCSGVLGNHNWLGRGGAPAVGELRSADQIDYRLPDMLGSDRERFAHAHTLVVGAGHAAATCVVALSQLAREAPYTQITWITRDAHAPRDREPIRRVPGDSLVARDRLAVEANRLAHAGAGDRLAHWPETLVEQIDWQSSNRKFAVRTSGTHASALEVDRVITCTGHRPCTRHREELQFFECYATQASACATRCADAELFRPPSAAKSADELHNPEPDFYVLGAASFGRSPGFTIAVGLEQIRLVFTILGDRPGLNLYESIKTLKP
jgi:hypothetical protein